MPSMPLLVSDEAAKYGGGLVNGGSDDELGVFWVCVYFCYC